VNTTEIKFALAVALITIIGRISLVQVQDPIEYDARRVGPRETSDESAIRLSPRATIDEMVRRARRLAVNLARLARGGRSAMARGASQQVCTNEHCPQVDPSLCEPGLEEHIRPFTLDPTLGDID